MPPNNAATVAVGGSVEFPNNGPSDGSRCDRPPRSNEVRLADPGIYEVSFQVSVTEAGQLELNLGGVEQPTTVVGRATGTSQIWANVLIDVTTP